MNLPRNRRIKNRAEFARVRKRGESISGRYLVMGYLYDETLEEPFKLGLITTRKVGNAVIRNRIRRRIRGILQRSVGEQLSHGHWIVLIARNSAARATSAQLEKEWRWMLRKVNVLNTEPTIASS